MRFNTLACNALAILLWIIAYAFKGVNLFILGSDMKGTDPLTVAHLYYVIFIGLLLAPLVFDNKK